MAKEPLSGWEKITVMATLAQAVVVIISIGFINSQLDLQSDQLKLQTDQLKLQSDQLQQQTELARAANIQSLAVLSIPTNLEEVRSGDLARLSLEGRQGFKPGIRIAENEVKESRYQTLLATWLIFYENIYYQNSKGLIDREMYAAWHKDLEDFVRDSSMATYWKGSKDSYHESFRNHIDELIQKTQSKDGNPEQP